MKPAHESPSVSVVIPTHDRPRFVRNAVLSVLEQDYPGPIEVVVVFDGGEAFDVAAPESTATRMVRVLTNNRKPGPLGTRNTGILAANGDIVAFLDDDDEWLPSKLSRQVEVLTSRPVDMVFSGVRFVAGDRQRDYIPDLPADDPVRGLIGGGVFIPIQTMIVWRRALEPDLLDENFPQGGDQELALRLLLRLRAECIPEPLVLINRAHTKRLTMRYERRIQNVEYMRVKHAALYAKYRPNLARNHARFALLAFGNRKRADARKLALRAVRANPRWVRGWLVALAVFVLPPISLDTLQALHHRLLWRRVPAAKR
jgi:glycosyltransferase involved in cell wall biosynthesis